MGTPERGDRRRWRRRLLLCAWILGAGAVVARSATLQVVQVDHWRAVGQRQHQRTETVPAPRGRILDRDGVPLAVSQETYKVSVAPHEIRDRAEAEELLTRALELSPTRVRAGLSSPRSWVVFPGRFSPAVREPLARVQGVYLERQRSRVQPYGGLFAGVLGTVDVNGVGTGGVEQTFDRVLAGRPGREIRARDATGRPIPGRSWLVKPPRSGRDVVLSLDMDLQEIAWEALADAIATNGARGGDLLISDPRTGEILAMVSLAEDGRPSLSAIHTPYEPGSTLKPFTVAALLGEGLAELGESVDAEEGTWAYGGRVVRDVHSYRRLTLADALRHSSNIGVGKFAERLPSGVQFTYLRDFGFGSPTGIPFPAEASGTLRRPDQWSEYSSVSLAIGYEVAVTPLQMAMAYGALANGGRLMEPRLVKEIRARNGSERIVREARVVRHPVSRRVAETVARLLGDVVQEGTGTAARLETFQVAGKTGTARYYGSEGYASGGYLASFVGFFPAHDPQLVILVKLDRPSGPYYGGQTAAPVTRSTLEAILAARRTPVDRRTLATVTASEVVAEPPPAPMVFFASRTLSSGGSRRMTAPEKPQAGLAGVPVPDVSDLTARAAIRRLHALGLRVSWGGGLPLEDSDPPAGTRVLPGETIRLRGGGDG